MARATQASGRTQRAPHAKQRAAFTELLFANPNHFGNFPESGLEPVFPLEANTAYEQLTCVGYNPDRDELEATVQIKLPSGYGGDLCSAGSTEYVRFYVDYGAGWQDAGLASFNAHDIANANDCAAKPTKPLTYVVTYPHAPRRSYCRQPTLPKVRAILSWNAMPPVGNPGWTPVWGNTVDRHVQIKPRIPFLIDLADAVASTVGKKAKLPKELEYAELEKIPLPDPPDPPFAELAELYVKPEQGAGEGAEAAEAVEPHRFGLQELQSASTLAFVSQAELSSKYAEWEELGLDLQAAIAALGETKNDVSYEQLDCLGLDYNRGWLVASLTIKRPTGYLGSLCRRGSYEYVAFWADWEDTCRLEYVGTVKLNVHDIASIPADGLHYWVGLPVTAELAKHRGPCQKPKLARIRAVLSWNAAPSTVNPDAVPHWGNRLDAHVEIRPGRPVSNQAEIDIIGGISVSQIDVAGNGMTTQGAVFAEWGSPADPFVIGALPGGGTGSTRLCPFGGRVNVQADVPASFAASGYKYRLMTHEVGSMAPPKPVTTPFLTAAGINPPVWRTPDPVTGYVGYLDPSQNVYNMLGWWEAGTLGDGLWELWLEMVDASLAPIGSTAAHLIQLDNTRPEADVAIASGGDCKDFVQGNPISGTLAASDLHFGHFDLYTLPSSLSPPNPATTRISSSATPDPATWTLATAGLKPCGYVIRLDVYDRTIVGSQPSSHNGRSDDTGLCLRKPA
jgi:hypothetical protein